MNKLKLEELAVESFDTTPAKHDRGGTVFAEQCTCPTACTCPGCPTCDPSWCDTACDTCGHSCGGTCELTCPQLDTCNWNTNCAA
jgi:hypothetical protein